MKSFPTNRRIPGGRTPACTTGPRSTASGGAAGSPRPAKLLEQMHDEDGYDEELADVSYWLGRSLVRLNKPTEALDAFNEAIRFDPEAPPPIAPAANSTRNSAKRRRPTPIWRRQRS